MNVKVQEKFTKEKLHRGTEELLSLFLISQMLAGMLITLIT